MNSKVISVVVMVSSLVWWMPASALEGEHMAGFPVGQPPQWPRGMADMLNSPNRVYGFFFNFGDSFFFAGDAQDFNDFVRHYAGLEGVSHRLILLPGRGKTGLFDRGRIGFDWAVSMSFYLQEGKPVGDAGVSLWVDGQVELEKVEVPANVVVQAGGDSGKIMGFISAREAERGEEKERAKAVAAMEAKSHEERLFKSERLLYGKVALTEDGSKVLSVVFDESGGTRSGYDLLFADVDFDGEFEKSERFAAANTNRHGSWLASSSFAPIHLNVPYSRKAEGVSNPCEVSLGYLQYPRHGVAEEISIVARFRLRQKGAQWEFAFSGGTKPAKSPEKASVWRVQDKPRMAVFARPDGYRKGNLGVGLTLTAGENKLECRKADQLVKVHVEIKTPEGEIVHRGDATPDRFTFG
jgi:hypothetical protein